MSSKFKHSSITSRVMIGMAFALSMLEASAQSNNYLMWQLPDSGITYPVYVYQNGKQIDYLYGPTQQAIISTYSDTTSASYNLYYSVVDVPVDDNRTIENQAFTINWFGCEIVLAKGQVDTTKSCSGTVINAPASVGSATSNVYTIATGATAWPSVAAPSNPVVTDYGKRQITFENNTDYQMIRIGQICTQSVNPHNLQNCNNTDNLFEIKKGKSAVFVVDNEQQEGSHFPAGLSSYGFTMTAYQNAKGQIVTTGGYDATPYATKIEFTSKSVNTVNGLPVPAGATNFDISAVDGYNISVRGYPSSPAFCTYTVPPENSNLLGAGYYSSAAPLAEIVAGESLCKISSQLPDASDKTVSGSTVTAWDLSMKTGGNYQGCMSPCTYAIKNGEADLDMFCCRGDFNTPGTCDQSQGQMGANTSTYVTNLVAPNSTHVYRFAYDDAIGDFACPAQTDFTIEFISPASEG